MYYAYCIYSSVIYWITVHRAFCEATCKIMQITISFILIKWEFITENLFLNLFFLQMSEHLIFQFDVNNIAVFCLNSTKFYLYFICWHV